MTTPQGPGARVHVELRPFDHGHGGRLSLLVRRTLAILIDTAGVTFLIAIFGYQAMTDGRLPYFAQDDRGFAMMLASAFAASLLLLFLLEMVTGTSIGKLVFGLHVRTIDGKRAGARQVLVRNVFRILDILGIGILLTLVSRHRQRLGDLASGTTVGRSPIGPFATIAGILLIAGLVWSEVSYGGGLASVTALATKIGTYAPDLSPRVNANVPQTNTNVAPQPNTSVAPQPLTSPPPQPEASASAASSP